MAVYLNNAQIQEISIFINVLTINMNNIALQVYNLQNSLYLKKNKTITSALELLQSIEKNLTIIKENSINTNPSTSEITNANATLSWIIKFNLRLQSLGMQMWQHNNI